MSGYCLKTQPGPVAKNARPGWVLKSYPDTRDFPPSKYQLNDVSVCLVKDSAFVSSDLSFFVVDV